MTLTDRLSLYEKLMRLDKPIGILLLAWPTLWGLWLSGGGVPDPMVFWIFALGVVLMRSAGCVINDYADRHFDPHVERTKNRPLAAGLVSEKETLLLALGLSLLSFLLILPLQNSLLVGLSFAAVFLAASYPFTKRFFAVPQAYLGVAFGFGIPMSYAAHLNSIPVEAWLLMLANVFWAMAYDTEYAMVDRVDDLRIGIKTSAITFGKYDVAAVMLCYALTLLILAWVGVRLHLHLWFYAGLGVAAAVAVYHWTLIRSRDPARCFKAFLHNNWFGAAVFAGIAASLMHL
jgi:4-hydroxybenzoate polyprenyltransferase